MRFDPSRVGQVETVAFSGVGYRHLAARYPDPFSGEGARIHGGRYTPAHSFATLYLCTTRACVVAEFEHLAQRQGLETGQLLPRILYQYRVELDRTLDLTVRETRMALEVPFEDLVSADWTLSQQIGDAAHHAGFKAVLAPSALGVDTVLAVFADHIEPTDLDIIQLQRWQTPEDVE